jgi:hypothetical protein
MMAKKLLVLGGLAALGFALASKKASASPFPFPPPPPPPPPLPLPTPHVSHPTNTPKPASTPSAVPVGWRVLRPDEYTPTLTRAANDLSAALGDSPAGTFYPFVLDKKYGAMMLPTPAGLRQMTILTPV